MQGPFHSLPTRGRCVLAVGWGNLESKGKGSSNSDSCSFVVVALDQFLQPRYMFAICHGSPSKGGAEPPVGKDSASHPDSGLFGQGQGEELGLQSQLTDSAAFIVEPVRAPLC